MTKKVLLLIADGSEEMEAVITIDCLRRAGIYVAVAGVASSNTIIASRGVKITPDLAMNDLPSSAKDIYDAIVLPGGMQGARTFESSKPVHALLHEFYFANKLVAAICAAPLALRAAQIGSGRKVTSYPSTKDEVMQAPTPFKAYVDTQAVVMDGNLITSRGPGTAFDFALALIEALDGAEAARKVREPLLVHESALLRSVV